MPLKHYGKKEVLALIDRMEDCFDRPFVYDLDKVEPQRGWAASAVGTRPLVLWHPDLWSSKEVQDQASRGADTECGLVWVCERG